MASSSDVAVVLEWHAALNEGDVERLLALSSKDVEVGGPRGSGRGAALLRDWAARSGISLEPGRCFRRTGTVVVEEQARWRSGGTAEAGPPQVVASVFRVGDGRVASVIRYPDLDSALEAAGLGMSDQVWPGG